MTCCVKALLPATHRELWDAYGANLPSDATLEWRLTRERGFTETGAKEFIREWRETMEFAQLDKLGRSDASTPASSPTEDEAGLETVQTLVDPQPTAESSSLPETDEDAPGTQLNSGPHGAWSVQTYPIPIALHGRPPVVISGAFPLSGPEWDQFKAVLDAMKPVLVSDESRDTGS